MDLRKGPRFGVSVHTFFCWERHDGTLQQGQGKTRDISARGIFVVCGYGPPPGAHIELDVYLPSISGAPKTVQLHGEGKVLRVDREGDAIKGFAANVDFQTETSDGTTVLNARTQ